MNEDTQPTGPPQLDIDVTLGPEAVGDFWNVMTQVRELGPVVWNDIDWSLKDHGQWLVNDYRTVMETATNWKGFSNEGGTASFQYDLEFFRMIPVESDPPLQRDVRKVLNPFFTPTALAANAAEIDATVDELIDACLDHPPVDFVTQFTALLPPAVFLPFLGQEKEHAGMLVSLIDTMLTRPDESAEATGQLIAWCEALLAARRAEGKSDDIPGVVAHLGLEGDGLILSDRQRNEILVLLVMAGMETTMGGLGTVAWQLGTRPDMREHLRTADDRTLNSAVEEFMRFASPVPTTARTAKADAAVGGCPVSSGDRLLINWASANLDPAQFPNPTEIDFERGNIATQVAFGAGIHRCLGAHLARREIKSTVRAISQLSVFELEPGHEVEWRSSMARGPKSLPVTMAR